MKKKFWRNVLLTGGAMMMMSGSAQAVEMYWYENDVTPPWGRISIVGATEVNNVNYVDKQTVEVQIYATDDMCKESEISYYLSTSPISEEYIPAWENDFTSGMTVEVELPSTSSMNTIYAMFRDWNGNESYIYSNSTATMEYNLNATDATDAPTGAATTITFGAPFVVTNQTPKREGYYFLGWSTYQDATEASYRQGDIIPADIAVGRVLYAVWTTNYEDLPLLADVVEIGDFVNYPVYYDNVATNGTSYIAKHKGWRVISNDDKDIDGNTIDGTVNLVSAGVPLTYYHPASSTVTSVTNLATNFLGTAFTASGTVGFQKTGFNTYLSLTQIFTNNYTATYDSDISVTYPTYSTNTVTATKTAGTLKVRAMTKEDLDKVYDPTGASVTSGGTDVSDEKYQDLLAIPCSDQTQYYVNYWFASGGDYNYLWSVYGSRGEIRDGYRIGGYGIRPVVSLLPEVRAAGTDVSGAWNIKI